MSWRPGSSRTPQQDFQQRYGNPRQPGPYSGSGAASAYGSPTQTLGPSVSSSMPMSMPIVAPPGISPELWQWFVAVDDDRNGRITVEELQRALINGNWSPFNDETCRLMLGMFDRDRSGTINIYEFEALWKYIQEWKRCFDSFDRDRSGTIDVHELNLAFQTFGYRLTNDFCSLVIKRFDREARGSINFDDFIQACVMLRILTDAFRTKDVNQTGTINVNYEQFLEMVLDTTIRH